MPDPEGFHLNRTGQQQLLELLDQIPDLVEDLAIAITKQTRMTNGLKVTSGIDEQPLPFDESASDAADQLRDTLASWVIHTCQHRELEGPQHDDTLTLTRWLKRWHFALAMSPHSDQAPASIRTAINDARRAIDRPRDPRWMHADRIAASDTKLNARGIEALAREMGGDYTGLNRERVRTLHAAGKIQPIDTDEDSDQQHLYRVGDVLAAHLAHPTRKPRRKTPAA